MRRIRQRMLEVPAEKGKEVEEAMPPPPVPAKKVLSPTTCRLVGAR